MENPFLLTIVIHLIMTLNLFIYLFVSELAISKKDAIKGIPFLFMVSNIWIIYWCWFVYDDLTKDSKDES